MGERKTLILWYLNKRAKCISVNMVINIALYMQCNFFSIRNGVPYTQVSTIITFIQGLEGSLFQLLKKCLWYIINKCF